MLESSKGLSRMYIQKLTIKNYRCFALETLEFNSPGPVGMVALETPRLPNVNLFIGNNGTGKTTLFQALVMVALRPYLADNISGFRTPLAIRFNRTFANADARLLLSPMDMDKTKAPSLDSDAVQPLNFKSTLRRKGSGQSLDRGTEKAAGWIANLFEDEHPACFLAAYGASRRTELREAYRSRNLGIRYRRVASLFEPHIGLMPLSFAYEQCQQRERWTEVVEIVNVLLPSSVHLLPERNEDGEPLFDYEGIKLPASELSDGYRLFVGWLIDCLAHLARVWPERLKLTDATGVVIVDEVDLFLAPIWQRTVLESLATTFPRIQWFCSTHSPLVAGSLESDNIYILTVAGRHTSQVRRPTDDFEGKSVETVLIELFNVQQPRSPELQRQLSNLAERALNGDMEASVEYLRRLNEGTARR
jgi:hypothetical protein